MRNVRMDICYDGSKYKGWQRLPGSQNTIQEKLEKTLSRILDEDIAVIASGRTDAGTHAQAQVVNFHCNSSMPTEEIMQKLRMYLPEDIGIYSCRNVSPRFHARLNALRKTYRYRIWNSNNPCVFDRKYVYVDPSKLDIGKMCIAAGYFLGTHDFCAFCGNKNMKKSTVRTIFSLDIFQQNDEIVITVTGNGFLQHMVRIIVGTLLEVGKGERCEHSIPDLFGARRELAGAAVPACGLTLMEVEY